jgi:predicted kinase
MTRPLGDTHGMRLRVDPSRAPRLILMCGLPGSGKTSVARRLADQVPAVRLCPDEWMAGLGVDLFDEGFRDRLEIRMWEHARELLRLGQNVILESGMWLRADRDAKRLGGRALGARVELHYLDVPFEELVRRVENREGWGTVPLSRALMEKYVGFFQAPDEAERALFD